MSLTSEEEYLSFKRWISNVIDPFGFQFLNSPSLPSPHPPLSQLFSSSYRMSNALIVFAGMYQIREANQMVEEFMLAANVSVAEKILNHFPSCSLLR